MKDKYYSILASPESFFILLSINFTEAAFADLHLKLLNYYSTELLMNGPHGMYHLPAACILHNM